MSSAKAAGKRTALSSQPSDSSFLASLLDNSEDEDDDDDESDDGNPGPALRMDKSGRVPGASIPQRPGRPATASGPGRVPASDSDDPHAPVENANDRAKRRRQELKDSRMPSGGMVVEPVVRPEVIESIVRKAPIESDINAAAGPIKRRRRTKVADFDPWERDKYQYIGLATVIAISTSSSNFSNHFNKETRSNALIAAIQKVSSGSDKFLADCRRNQPAAKEYNSRFDQSSRGNASVRMNMGYCSIHRKFLF